MRDWKGITIIVLVVILAILIYRYHYSSCFYLPDNSDPKVFGPSYWKALHSIVDRIPCPGCRSDAVPLMSFMHDIVNKKLDKPLWDEANFNTHVNQICKLKTT